ncbi:sensor histidine kinase [Blautia difficilis]|uniref:sensor histidine kinase n=1 Tax=Blautia difficilis TaxID=2763027 RepID=UPI003D9665BB
MFRTIKRKLIFVFCVVSILFVCVSTGIFYKVFTNRLISTQQNNQNMLSQALCTSIEYFREKCETTINMLQEDEEIHSSVAQWLLFDDEETLQECLRKKVNEWDFINNILIMKTSYEYVGAKELDQILPYMVDRISTAERYGQNCVWDSGYGPNSSFVFRCFNVSEAEKNLYLFIQIANANFQSLFNRYRLQNDQRFSLKGITNGFEVTEQGFYYQYYDNYSQLVHTQIDIDDWQLKTWSEKTAARIVTKEFWVEMITIFLVLILLIILLSVIISKQVTKPIKEMQKVARQYSLGAFDAKVSVHGKDEIAELGNVLNNMSSQLLELISSVTEKERQSNYLELQTLIYQINPHFLYNTLDSINMLARKNDDIQVALMVTNLSRLFRLSLNRGRDVITVREEMMQVTYYLKIQKFRFEEQLDWNINFDDEILEYRMLKFIMQPLVENAIYHGIKSKNEYGKLTIRGYKDKNMLIFVIKDTGKGMDEDTLTKLYQRINEKKRDEKENRGYGIWNVNQRIKLYYGEQYGLQIDSIVDKGTSIYIKIPAEI